MKNYIIKIKHLLPTILLILLSTIIGIALMRWVLSIRFHLVDIHDDIWTILVPFIISVLSVSLWLKKRFRILAFDDNVKVSRFIYLTIVTILIIAPNIVVQSYINTNCSILITLSNPFDNTQLKQSRYYKFDRYYIDKSLGAFESARHRESRGRGSSTSYFDIYFITPIITDSIYQPKQASKYWCGIHYQTSYPRLYSSEQRDSAQKAFFEEYKKKIEQHNFMEAKTYYFDSRPFDRLERGFLKTAIKTGVPISDTFVVLTASEEPYEKRNGDKLTVLFGLLAFSIPFFLFLLIFPDIDEKELKRQQKK